MSLIRWLLDATTSSKEREAFFLEQRPVVIMGRGHSGTRVLAWACAHLGIDLGTSDDLATGDASDRNFTERVKRIAVRELRRGDVESATNVRRLRAASRAYHAGLGSPSGLWGWKFPETYVIAPLVTRAFPRVRYLHLVRDGRDIAFKNHLTDNPRRKLGRAILELNSALDEPRHIQAAVSWKYQVDSFDRFKAGLPKDQVLDLRFEDLCLHPFEEISRVCEFLGVLMTDACRRYLETEIKVGKVSQHRENDPALVVQVEDRIRDTLQRWRYV